MDNLFLHFLNASLGAIPLVAAVVLARAVLKKAPRWTLCLLWAVVAVRLLAPALPQSSVGLAPAEPLVTFEQMEKGFYLEEAPTVQPGLSREEPQADSPERPASHGPTPLNLASGIWALGAAGMLLYLWGTWLRLGRLVSEAVRLEENVYLCDRVTTPFVLGLFRPRIYLPSGMEGEDRTLVLAHERGHLARRDHWWKPLGFLLLALTWFNPVMWFAYGLLCRDIELACDEKVAAALDGAGKKAYSQTLVRWSGPRALVLSCPLAFGEVAVKDRVKKVLAYQKPGLRLALPVLAAALIFAGCFLTERSPAPEEPELPETVSSIPETAPRDLQTQEAMEEELERYKAELERLERDIAEKYTGSFTHAFSQGENRYTGGQLCLDYRFKPMGGLTKAEFGILLLLDGQPQPYRLSENGELKYMHTFTGPSQPELWFTPVTGSAGDTLDLTAFSVLEPDCRNEGTAVPFAGSMLPAHTQLVMQAEGGAGAQTLSGRVTGQTISFLERSGNQKTPQVELPAIDGTLHVRATVTEPALWVLTTYVNNEPMASVSFDFREDQGPAAKLEYWVELPEAEPGSLVYAILSCPHWRELEKLPPAFTESKPYYLKVE